MERFDFNSIFSQAVEERANARVAEILAAERAKKKEIPSDIAPNGEVVTPYLFDGEKFLSSKQACTLLGVKYPSLWRWNKSGILKHIKTGGRVLYKYTDIKNFLNGKSENQKGGVAQ